MILLGIEGDVLEAAAAAISRPRVFQSRLGLPGMILLVESAVLRTAAPTMPIL
jgi:hypothetical protein